MGLLVDTAKTTGIGYILFQFDLRYPLGRLLPELADMLAGPMNFSLQGALLVVAKGSWADLSHIESEIVGYWHASRTLHYHIRGAPIVYSFVDHRPSAEMYEKRVMFELTPRMLKLMKELMEYPFKMKYMSGRAFLIEMVYPLSRAGIIFFLLIILNFIYFQSIQTAFFFLQKNTYKKFRPYFLMFLDHRMSGCDQNKS